MPSYLHRGAGFYRRVFQLALPVVLQNLITTSLGFMDTFMVGLLGDAEMSAVTVANTPVFIMQLILFGLQSGSSVLISQYWGKGDRESINRVLGIGLYAALCVSSVFSLVLFFRPAFVLGLVTDNPALIALATPYIRIVGFSYVFNALASIYVGMQRSIENPRFGMTLFAVSTAVNTLGNYLLIFGKLGLPALGVTGAAVATLSARVLEFAVAAVYALRCRALPLQRAPLLRPGFAMLRSFIRYSTPVVCNETLWGLGYSMFTVVLGHMAISTEILSAYTVAGNIDRLITAAIFGVAAATTVIVGKEIGMGNRDEILDVGRALCFAAFAVGCCVGVLEQAAFWLLVRPYLLPLFHLTADASSICTMLICCYSAAAPINSLLITLVTGVLRGGGDVHAALLIDLVPLWCVNIPLLALCALVWHAPLLTVCFLIAMESLFKIPFGMARLRSGKWIHDVTVGAQ